MKALKGLHTLVEIALACGKSVSSLENYRRLGLISGYKVAKSKGRGRGRVVLYDAELILREVKEVDEGLGAGKSLEEMSKESGWIVRGGVSFQRDETLADLVGSCCESVPRSIRQRLVRAADFAARNGLFECEHATLPWKVRRGKDDVVLLYVDNHGREEIADVVRGMVESGKDGNIDAAVTYAVAEWTLRNEELADHSFPSYGTDAELGLSKEEANARAREVRRSGHLQDQLEDVKRRCRKSGTGFPSFGGDQDSPGAVKG